MACRLKLRIIFAAVVVALLTVSCAYVKKHSIDKTLNMAQEHMNAHEYQNALDDYRASYAKYPGDVYLTEHYISNIEAIKKVGDRANAKEDFDKAQSIYQILLSNYSDFAHFEKNLSFDRESLKKLIDMTKVNQTDKAARQEISKGNTQKALELYSKVYSIGINYPELRNKFSERMEEIKRSADRAYGKGDFARAGMIFRSLIRNPFVESFSGMLSFNARTLQRGITECSEHLKKKGIELYRKGRIAEAISVWQSILPFDNNQDIRNAISNASEHLRKLQK